MKTFDEAMKNYDPNGDKNDVDRRRELFCQNIMGTEDYVSNETFKRGIRAKALQMIGTIYNLVRELDNNDEFQRAMLTYLSAELHIMFAWGVLVGGDMWKEELDENITKIS